MNLQQDEVIDRYRVETLVGEGGMARVYRVRHTQLGSLHALKVLAVPVRSVRERLLQEGRVQASLKHRNVVHVHDIIDVEGSPGLVMEYIAGPSLAQLLERTGALSWAQVDALATGLLRGMLHAHQVGVVHRDLKPGNVLLAQRGGRLVPKITDFGLAKVLSTGKTSGSTRSGVAMGTPSYMAPEQIRDSKSVGPAADLWSLGTLLYEVVTGERAFLGTDVYDTYERIMHRQLVPIDERPEPVYRVWVGDLSIELTSDFEPLAVQRLVAVLRTC